jgi:hypothetical protein
MNLRPEEVEAVGRLDGPKRYRYFVKMVADQHRAWGLYLDGWALAADENGRTLFPLWPAKAYAELCVRGDWSEYEPCEISLDDLLNDLLPKLRDDQFGIAVFYLSTDKGVAPSMEEFERDIRNELSQIE